MRGLDDCQDLFLRRFFERLTFVQVDPPARDPNSALAIFRQEQFERRRCDELAIADLERWQLSTVDQLVNALARHLERFSGHADSQQRTVLDRRLNVAPQQATYGRFLLNHREQLTLLGHDLHRRSIPSTLHLVKRKKAADAPTPDTLLITPTA